jgi:hypothetical protein
MKLTEAQLKAIIAEEVQAAIEEGLFGAIGGAAKGLAGLAGKAAGAVGSAAGKAAGAVGRAASAAGGKAYGALDKGISAAEKGLDVVGRGVGSAIGAAADAGGEVLDAARMGSLKSDVNKTVGAARATIQKLEKLAGRAKGNEQFMELLSGLAGEFQELAKASTAAAKQAGGMSQFRRDYSTATAAGLEEQIAESIVRRITQESKRRR